MQQIFTSIGLLLFVLLNTSFSQQFIQEWEFSEWLIYVGDIDGDGIGEFVSYDEDNLSTTFYDGQNHNVKWTITGQIFNEDIFSREKASAHPTYLKFPSIDFNGDGKRDIFFKPSDGRGILIVDVVNNKTIFEWTDSQISWATFDALSDVDGDDNLELVFHTGQDGVGYKTYVYSTNIQINDVEEINVNIPNDYDLSQNYPNPFNPSTTIEYQIPKSGKVSMKIYDITGRLVKIIERHHEMAGNYTIGWDGTNDYGIPVSTGNYIYKMIIDGEEKSKKMLLIK